MAGIERRFYKMMSAASSENDDYVIASGVILDIREVGGNAAAVASTEVSIIWDPAGANEILMSTHGDALQSIQKSVTGDGSKILRIRLVNDQLSSDTLGAFWRGVLYG